MPLPAYLFVFDQNGPVFTTSDPPTSEDFEHARVGTALIVRLRDWHVFDSTGEWRPIPEGVVGRAQLDDALTPPFHGPPDYFRSGGGAQAQQRDRK